MNSKSEFALKLEFIEKNINKLSDGGLQRECEAAIQLAFSSDASIHKKQLEDALDKLNSGRDYLKQELYKQIENAYAQSEGRKRARS